MLTSIHMKIWRKREERRCFTMLFEWSTCNFYSWSYNPATKRWSIFFAVVSTLVEAFRTAEICLWSARYPKKVFCYPRKIACSLFLQQFFSFSRSSTIMADVGKLLWTPTSYMIFVVVHCTLDCEKTFVLASFMCTSIRDSYALQDSILVY